MKCRVVIDSMDMYFDKKLSNLEVNDIEKHLTSCKKCRDQYENTKSFYDILDNHDIISPPIDFTENIMDMIEDVEIDRHKKHRGGSKWGLSFVAAGILFAFISFSSFNYQMRDLSVGISQKVLETNEMVRKPLKEISEGLSYLNNYFNIKK
ncbi:anti-sigma factor family protein [Dethiothermospora halolimnae]|uniref:anti-sigma factor family protein n=1 Tax=Dethiothermospora halolimnae TaxID=3114390 RepID=UPI003CCB870F